MRSVCTFLVCSVLLLLAAQGGRAATARCPRRTAAYQLDNPRQIRGYFPAGSELEILEERPGYLLAVRFTSSSGKVIEALVQRSAVQVDGPLPSGTASTVATPETTSSYRPRNADEVWTEINPEDMDTRMMTVRERGTLALPGMDWDCAHTEHFVIHYTHGMFARKVARMAEFFYHYISTDLGAPQDLMPGRSHIFIFRNKEEWDEFMKAMPISSEWAFSYVAGPSMYLQQADDTKSSSDVLAHEMTHLILNRFFRQQPPLWLNEGMAEWYELFAYSAFKGTKKSKGSQFQKLPNPYPLKDLVHRIGYPENTADVLSYYNTARFLVGFLRLKRSDEEFVTFIQGVMKGQDPIQLLLESYDFKDLDDLSKAFEDFHT